MKTRLTIPSDALLATFDQRKYHETEPAFRSEAQRDRDRILYSSALLRLGHITQVAAPEVGHIFHSRLTHSLKVAQVARRLAERFKRLEERTELDDASARLVYALDEDSAEAAALAHDLGHPPYGHLAEQELQSRAKNFGSFEGNAQSFRIVTALAAQSTDLRRPGLNLTRRTLNGLLKYPWLRDPTDDKRRDKWGAYQEDADYFNWAREDLPSGERTIEAEIMDWADDVTYAVHDMDDFYRAGLIPLERLAQSRGSADELREFEDYLRRKHPGKAGQYTDAAERLFGFFTLKSRYRGRAEERADLRALGSWLITRYINTAQLVDAGDGKSVFFELGENQRDEVDVLKELTWFYIIERPSLATIQHGQRRVIRTLFYTYRRAAKGPNPETRLFPPAFAERISGAGSEDAKGRIVVDLIASMTEQSAHEICKRAVGVSAGSVVASAAGPF